MISGRDIEVDPKKVEAIVDLSPPSSVIETRSFLDMAGYYRKLTTPLVDQEDTPFIWSKACHESFE